MTMQAESVQPVAGMRGYLASWRSRLASGDLGSLPVVVGLAVIWTVFQVENHRFLSAENLANLLQQVVGTGTIAIGIVLVLLLGEIDLSVGSVSGLCGSILAVLNVKNGMNPVEAIIVALVAGAVIGLVQGFVFSRFGVPSFVVTLAGLIGWQGAQLYVLGKTGTVNFVYTAGVAKLTTVFFSPIVGWALAVVLIAIYLVSRLTELLRRRSASLRASSTFDLVVRTVAVAVFLLLAVFVLNAATGVPLSVVIFIGLVVLVDLMIRHTRYGRHILAVGGNAEAARRAGIRVPAIRISVFVLSGVLASAGGILAASRLIAVTQSSGSGDVLLNAIAAAVIGGTSLFGGRGTAYSALLGIVVIGSISNGMDLLNLNSAVKFMITGLVLLTAVTVDALARRGRQSHGRA